MNPSQPLARKVALNIWKTAYGWRVFVRAPDPVTGKSKLVPKRFKDDGRPEREQIEDLAHFRDAAKLEAQRQRRQHRRTRTLERPPLQTFAADAERYLALEPVKAMPGFKTREREMALWVRVFGTRARASLTTRDIDDELQKLRNSGYSGSSVNKFRTALMSLYTRLDGPGRVNPVKGTHLFEEAEIVARGQSYDVLTRILDAIDDGPSRARLEVMAWTGMDPKPLKRMTPAHISLADRWFVTPKRDKGNRRRRTPQPVIEKPMVEEAVAAFARFVETNAWGHFSTDSLRRVWNRAEARVEKALQAEYGDPSFRLPHVRLKDLRHSFATEAWKHLKGNAALVAQLIDHAPGSPMTQRYALGAVPGVLRTHMDQFRGRRTR